MNFERNGTKRTVRETLSESVPHPGKPGWKKFLGWIVAIATVVAGRKLGLSPNEVALITGATGTYILGQGIADFGKEKTVNIVKQVEPGLGFLQKETQKDPNQKK